MKTRLILYLLLLMPLSVIAQTDREAQTMRQKRYSMIHMHHVGVGIEAEAFENFRVSPRVFYGIGSFRNVLNAEIGLKYVYNHPLLHAGEERVAAHYISPFVAGIVNFYRWSAGSLYAGGEVAYNFAIAGDHYLPSAAVQERDSQIGNHHCSLRPKIGVRLENWDVSLHFEYDLAPSLNQKHLFESAAYDYYALKPSLFERYRLGIHVAYIFPF